MYESLQFGGLKRHRQTGESFRMGDFVNAVLKDAEEGHQRPLGAQNSGKKAAHLVHEERLKHGISTEELRRGSRRTRVSRAISKMEGRAGGQ